MSQPVSLTFPDGSSREFAAGTTGRDVAESISKSLAKKAIAMALDAMDEGGAEYDGFVALGVVIRGETHHFDIVANESARGLMTLSISESLALGNGIMTTENAEQAWERVRKDRLDKGGFAARAALSMIALKDNLAG